MRRLCHLFALNAFCILQPALDQLSGNPEYLILENYRLAEVAVVVLCLAGFLPCLQLAAVAGLEKLGRKTAADRLMTAWLGLGGALFGLVLGRWLAARLQVWDIAVPQTILALLALPAAIAVPLLCRRSEPFRQLLALCAAGTLLFPLGLLAVPAARFQLLGQPISARAAPGQIGNPVPVVMIVFDGLNGMSLLNADRQINRNWFPGFARLADISTYYRNASTVHPRTDHSVPAMLTSSIPEQRQQPVEVDYPTGLFRLIFDSRQYDMSVFEPLTRMAPAELRQLSHQRSAPEQIQRLLGTLLRVCVRISIPQELPFQPAIPREWFGLLPITPSARKPMQGQIIYGWDEKRSVQADHFISTLKAGTRPGFHFLHIALPHYPWSLLPDGRNYLGYGTVASGIYGLENETWADDPWPARQAWHRNLMQIQCADHVIGRILDTLSENGQLEKTLLVVTSDHGMCFVPGKSLRDPSQETLADLLPVPLFIRLPGQAQNAISDRNVETIDILPTIAEVLRIRADPQWEGSSLLSGVPRPRKTVHGVFDTVLEPDFPARFGHLERMWEAVGQTGETNRIQSPQAIPELVGRKVSEFESSANAGEMRCALVPRMVAPLLRPPPIVPSEPFVPCLIQGRLLGPVPDGPVWLAIAAGGRILATTRTSSDLRFRQTWAAWVDPERLPGKETRLEVYRVENRQSRPVLVGVPIREGSGPLQAWEPDWIFSGGQFE
ncbi:MAG: sulfatase-like hydrolase/transferase [Planctomycetota bacterium]